MILLVVVMNHTSLLPSIVYLQSINQLYIFYSFKFFFDKFVVSVFIYPIHNAYIHRLYAMGVRVDDTLPCVERDDLYREHPDIPDLPEFSHLPPIHITRNEVFISSKLFLF